MVASPLKKNPNKKTSLRITELGLLSEQKSISFFHDFNSKRRKDIATFLTLLNFLKKRSVGFQLPCQSDATGEGGRIAVPVGLWPYTEVQEHKGWACFSHSQSTFCPSTRRSLSMHCSSVTPLALCRGEVSVQSGSKGKHGQFAAFAHSLVEQRRLADTAVLALSV